MSDNDEQKAPGTASEPRVKRTGCGFRYDEDELKEGIDFSAAKALLRGLAEEGEDPAQTDAIPGQADDGDT